jgi:hypothetical protein
MVFCPAECHSNLLTRFSFKGYFDSKEKFEEVSKKCVYADLGISVEDCPEHFSLACRPSDLVDLAKEILEFYK